MGALNQKAKRMFPSHYPLTTYNTISTATTILNPIAGLAKSTCKTLGLALAVAATEQRAFCQRQCNLGFVTIRMKLATTISAVYPLLIILLLTAEARSRNILLFLGSPGLFGLLVGCVLSLVSSY